MDFYKNQASKYKTWIEVDAASLRHNFSVLTKYLGKGVTPLCVVKSNAYGHGLVEAATLLSHVRSPTSDMSEVGLLTWFGVDSIDEALILRKAGSKNLVLILGYVPKTMLEHVVRNNFRVVLYDLNILDELQRLAKRLHKKVSVHLKIETGTYRQGMMVKDVPGFIPALKRNSSIEVEGVYTHFSDTEDTRSSYYKQQLEVFKVALGFLREHDIEPTYTHAASTAASMLYPEAHFSMARLGIGLYGMYPSQDVKHRVFNKMKLRPALTWKTRVAQVKEIKRGDTVGYSRTFRAPKRMSIAVLPVGYWDGYDRGFSGNAEVLIHGKRAPVIARICMNMCMVDISCVPGVRADDEVVLLGKQGRGEISAEDLAERIGTINYEITTRINPLLPRVVV